MPDSFVRRHAASLPPTRRTDGGAPTLPALLAVRAVAFALAVLPLAGCETVERLDPEARRAEAASITGQGFDVPDVLRGTIAQDTVITGYQPVPVHGYGLVVGLDGTGSTLLPPDLREHMLREMRRRGVGSEQAGMGRLDPDAMLDSPSTAVVVVEGLVPPGGIGRRDRGNVATAGTRFDVRVSTDPRTGATSIEGGRLYTMELRPVQPGAVFPPTGSAQAAALARARGPLVVNPFAERDVLGQDTVDRTSGLIMNGGEVAEDMPMKLRLLTPSHARANLIQSALNTRFPREPGQPDDTARGESDESIVITVPPSYSDRPDEFISLVKHSSMRQVRPEAVAARIARIVENDPGTASLAAWRWEALGPRALPMIREMYDHPAESPRMAALRAGSRLGDPLVVPDLLDMTRSDDALVRMRACRLLEPLEGDARIDARLRELLDDPDLDVRLVAYEALNARGSRYLDRILIEDSFRLDIVDSRFPLVYVAQTGRPRIVLFDPGTEIRRPVLAEAFGGRMIIKASALAEEIEVYFRPENGGPPLLASAPANLAEFILFISNVPEPDDPDDRGLGMSYADTLAVLYALRREGALESDFKAEQDRVRAAILRQRTEAPQTSGRPLFELPDPAETAPGIEDVVPAGSGDAPVERLPGLRAAPPAGGEAANPAGPPPASDGRPLGLEPPPLTGGL